MIAGVVAKTLCQQLPNLKNFVQRGRAQGTCLGESCQGKTSEYFFVIVNGAWAISAFLAACFPLYLLLVPLLWQSAALTAANAGRIGIGGFLTLIGFLAWHNPSDTPVKAVIEALEVRAGWVPSHGLKRILDLNKEYPHLGLHREADFVERFREAQGGDTAIDNHGGPYYELALKRSWADFVLHASKRDQVEDEALGSEARRMSMTCLGYKFFIGCVRGSGSEGYRIGTPSSGSCGDKTSRLAGEGEELPISSTRSDCAKDEVDFFLLDLVRVAPTVATILSVTIFCVLFAGAIFISGSK
eukprot:CAMPEP_0115388778 /NCGR_PEP_ID=MMETSP0271-20121206/9352_1 /TAXON_ID=71861 /ORGANISM="Scrippsiella trochoidea, Strain CCMP3099" /LENGTH=299 /DNA_ID=CAMNT_0002812281 /DNA_START=224 /DNA_END=1123 /DNA_ORIENTATION=+